MNKSLYELSKLGINIPNRRINDRYTLTENIGSGTFGDVYIAKDKITMKKYVAKITGISEIFEIYFYIITMCEHPNLICLHDYFIIKDELYLIYNYIPNAYDLVVLSNGLYISPWYVDYLIKVLLDVSSALKYIHNKGILHLDIKPTNILIVYPQNKPLDEKINVDEINGYLIDYGFTCLKGNESEKFNEYLCINHFPKRAAYRYYAPEMLNRDIPINEISYASDIYALGITIQDVMLDPLILNIEYVDDNDLIFLCQADELNNEYLLLKNAYNIPIDIADFLMNSDHKYAGDLFNLSVKMINIDPLKRPTIDEVINELLSF